MRTPCVYILTNKPNGTLYVGVTSDPRQRIWQHKNELVESFSRTYGLHRLVWYEVHATMEGAITREKAIKRWRRLWKKRLIEKSNPEWRDLYQQLT
jgi:putative endonuclease